MRLVERHTTGVDVIVAENYGEAGALVIGYSRDAAGFCTRYRVVARIPAANDSDEGGEPIARCTLRGTLADLWPSIIATHSTA